MMKLLLPLFPVGTKLVSDCLGVYEKDGLVQYIVNGLPVYSHNKEDLNSFRYITSNFIHQGLCRKIDVQRCFQLSEDSVQRSYNKFISQGVDAFFGEDGRKGRAYKIIGERREKIQRRLDNGQSVNSIAKDESVAESAIRYGIKQGYLKKTVRQTIPPVQPAPSTTATPSTPPPRLV